MQVSDSKSGEMGKEVSGGLESHSLNGTALRQLCDGWVLQVLTAVPFSGACSRWLLGGLPLGVAASDFLQLAALLSALLFWQFTSNTLLSAGTHHPSWQFSGVGFSMVSGQLSLLFGPHLVHEKLLGNFGPTKQ